MQSAFYCYVALNTCLYNHNKASIRSPTVRELRYFSFCSILGRKTKRILCTITLDSLDVLKLGHGLSSLKTVFWLNQLGFVKIQKGKLTDNFFLQVVAVARFPGLNTSWSLCRSPSMPSARRCLECVVCASLRRGHGRHGRSLGLGRGSGGALFLLEGVLAAAQGGDHAVTELLVHADVDDRVVDGRGLGKEGWYCHEDGSKTASLVGEDVPGRTGIGGPTNQVGEAHEDDHAGDLALSPLRGLGLLLLGSGIFDGADETTIAEEDHNEGNEGMDKKHVDDEGLVVEALGTSVVVDSA